MLAADFVVLHLARIEVQVAQDGDRELVVVRQHALLLLLAELVLIIIDGLLLHPDGTAKALRHGGGSDHIWQV